MKWIPTNFIFKRHLLFLTDLLGAVGLLGLTGCAGTSVVPSQNIDSNIYLSSGIERFFLPQRPQWSQVSEIGECSQDSVGFLDFFQLSKEYHFSYDQAVLLQHQLYSDNDEGVVQLSSKEREQAFFEAYQKMDNLKLEKTISPYRSPRVYIFSIDHLEGIEIVKLRKEIERKFLPQGQVFILSRCLGSKKLEKWKERHDIYPRVGVIGLEFFAIYNRKMEVQRVFSLDLSRLFPSSEVYFIETTAGERNGLTGYKKAWLL